MHIRQDVYGPWDYFNPSSHKPTPGTPMGAVRRVTNVHLKPRMLTLTRGATSKIISPDLDYTLTRIPNHPRALDLASRLEQAIKQSPYTKKFADERMPRTADCYFERAIKFTPQQGATYMLYGLHKQRNKQYQEAINYYKTALNLGYESVEMHYNLGLSYYYTQNYNQAKEQAEKAYAGGYPLDGLRNLLKEANIELQISAQK